MADPLSAAGLALSVVSLGLQLSGGIAAYIDALNCREKEIASVRHQNDSLQKFLQVIESSLPRFQPNHSAATAVVHEYLNSCKTELGALESLVSEFTGCDKPTTSRKDNLKAEGKKLLYPFSRPKLEQLEARISRINSALQLALQALDL